MKEDQKQLIAKIVSAEIKEYDAKIAQAHKDVEIIEFQVTELTAEMQNLEVTNIHF